jgi:hypothetical protein
MNEQREIRTGIHEKNFITTLVAAVFGRKRALGFAPYAGSGPWEAKSALMAGIMLVSGWNRPFDGPPEGGNAPARRVGCPMMGQIDGVVGNWVKTPSFFGQPEKVESACNFFMIRLLSKMKRLKN